MTLVVKTGMQSEYDVARSVAASDVVVLTGVQTLDDLQKLPPTIEAVLSFGLCGGLSPQAQIGQAFVYDTIDTPDGVFQCDVAWRRRLFGATRYYERHCWSSGKFNTANTIAERASLLAQTGCWIVDDETFVVAQFAQARGIPFAGLRVVSDGAEDDLPPAVLNALNPNGTTDLDAVIPSVIGDPLQIPALLKTAREFELAIAELRTAVRAIGPQFQWIVSS